MDALGKTASVIGSVLILTSLMAGPATAETISASQNSHTNVTIASPRGGSETSAAPEFHGTGEAKAPVVVTDGVGTVLCAARVGTDGTWSCTSIVDMADGPTQIHAVQNAWGRVSDDRASFTVKLAKTSPQTPLWAYYAGGAAAVVLLLLAAALTIWYRTRKNPRTRTTRRTPPTTTNQP